MTRKEANKIYLKVLDDEIQKASKEGNKEQVKKLLNAYDIICDYENALDYATESKKVIVYVD